MTEFAISARRRALTLLATMALLGAGLGVAQPGRASSVGSGHPASEERAVSGFRAIALRGPIDVVVRQGSREAVQVRADDNLLPLVQTFVDGQGDGGTLRIQLKHGESVRHRTPIVVTVDVIALTALSSAGSGNISVEPLKTPSLALSLSGSSDARLRQLDTEALGIRVAGSGDVQASGRAARLDVSIAGSGDVRTRELVAGEVSISIAGSGDASVAAQRTISVAIAGSGEVDYSGGAVLIKSRIAGSGSVRQHLP